MLGNAPIVEFGLTTTDRYCRLFRTHTIGAASVIAAVITIEAAGYS